MTNDRITKCKTKPGRPAKLKFDGATVLQKRSFGTGQAVGKLYFVCENPYGVPNPGIGCLVLILSEHSPTNVRAALEEL